MKDRYGARLQQEAFFKHMKRAAGRSFFLEKVMVEEALGVATYTFGCLQEWYDGKC